MNPSNMGEGFPLSEVAKSLAPYIKTRQEALRIRRILSIFLAQNIDSAKSLSLTSLAVPSEDATVKRIPPELSGLRKHYLKAVQAYVKARDEHKKLIKGPEKDALKAVRQDHHQIEDDTSTHVTTYLELLQAQRKYQKLRILQDYLDLLARKDAAQPDYLSIESILNEIPPTLELPSAAFLKDQSEDSTSALILRLEKALLRARNTYEKEKQLLAQIKSEQHSEAPARESDCTIGSTQIAALRQTRDELVSWIEERLAQGQMEETPDKAPFAEEVNPLNIEQRKKAIEAKYEEYLQVRKSLLALLSAKKLAPLHQSVEKCDDPSSQRQHNSKDSIKTNKYEASMVLPYITQYLIPAANAQKGFLQHKSHLSKILADQHEETVSVLEKLANESHLLSNYPLLAAQPRLQNTVAALGPKLGTKISGCAESSEGGQETESVTLARGWAFAASAARSAKQDEVLEHLEHGETHVEIAKDRIRGLREILVGRSEQKEADKGDDDFRVDQAGKNPKNRPEVGIWSGLDGNLSLYDDSSKNRF